MTQKAHSTARGLASLGRNGDSTLVHMSPREVQGLQNLALRHGTTLTINPHTGMPEAFSLEKLLPMLGGAALSILAPELVLPAAVAAGGIKKAEGGSWTDAIGTGLQVYGGGQLATGLTAAGAPASQAAATSAAEGATGATGATGVTGVPTPDKVMGLPDGVDPTKALNVNMAGTGGNIPIPEGYEAAGTPGVYFDKATGDTFSTASGDAGKIFQQEATKAIPTPTPDAASRWAGLKEGASSMKGWESAVGDTNMAGKAGLLSGAMEAAKEEPVQPKEQKPVYYIQKEGGPALYEQGKVNPNLAKLGYIPAGESYYVGQKFNPGVYSYSPTEYKPVEGMRKGGLASLTKYDGGGAVPKEVGQQMLASQPAPQAPQGGNQALQGMNQFYANQLQASQSAPSQMNQPTPSASGINDWVANYNKIVTPVTTPDVTPADGTASSDGATPPSATQDSPFADTRMSQAEAQKKYDADFAAFQNRLKSNYAGNSPNYGYGRQSLPKGYNDALNYWKAANTMGEGNYSYKDESSDNPAFLKGMAAGGLANLGGTYAAGGKLLRGAGDGMSDSIPAVIGGQKPQRAALADGEFVVPADVVSHLGNGSTEAGSRKLYAMMDKIRRARTGKKKQAPAVKAERFMPK